MSRRNSLLASAIGGGGKVVNHITYTVSDNPVLFGNYQLTFYSEYPVKSIIKIGISNGSIINLNADYDTGMGYFTKSDSVLGISFSNENFMTEIEDDFFIYKIEL